jgi:hypothetical protein
MNKRAVKTFIRLWEPIALRHYEGEAMDYWIDYGEWSAGSRQRMWDNDMRKLADRVAPRFNMHPEALINDHWTYWMDQSYKNEMAHSLGRGFNETDMPIL